MKRNNTSITAVSSPRNNKRGPVKEISSIRGLINSRSGGLIKTRLNLSPTRYLLNIRGPSERNSCFASASVRRKMARRGGGDVVAQMNMKP